MFDLSLTEILLVLIAAVIFIGPEEIPRVARTLAKVARSIRYMSSEIKRVFDQAVDMDQQSAAPRAAPRKFILDDDGNYREIYDLDDFLPERSLPQPEEKPRDE